MKLTAHRASGPPMMMPMVAAKNMMMALGPRFQMPLRSMLRQSNTRLAGNR